MRHGSPNELNGTVNAFARHAMSSGLLDNAVNHVTSFMYHVLLTTGEFTQEVDKHNAMVSNAVQAAHTSNRTKQSTLAHTIYGVQLWLTELAHNVQLQHHQTRELVAVMEPREVVLDTYVPIGKYHRCEKPVGVHTMFLAQRLSRFRNHGSRHQRPGRI